ncbi:unnamed protein product [Cylicocyclus nassatus]|uniref:BTB domain-containing protein n=1 Tax=Cylicocyclus nassatus TaxID=53992 RepID=A0AA36DP80_CYLNA|nr:unnamed protein product [Cylicocyclus nassatus]
MSSTEDRSDHLKGHGRVKVNVGGTIFETTISTLTRVDNTVLSTMVADRWQNQEELFVDRSPTHFEKILNYLRDGNNFILPADLEARESLRREAEFYNLPGLAELCSPGFHVGDWVQWNEAAIEAYWKFIARALDESAGALRLDIRANSYEGWTHVKHEMQFMKGFVTQLNSKTCCTVEWDAGWRTHLTQSALRLAKR